MSNPSFPVVTLAIWNSIPSDLTDQIRTKAIEMATAGKTDNVPDKSGEPPDFEVRRNWLDTAAANEWVAFIDLLDGPLTSISIV